MEQQKQQPVMDVKCNICFVTAVQPMALECTHIYCEEWIGAYIGYKIEKIINQGCNSASNG